MGNSSSESNSKSENIQSAQKKLSPDGEYFIKYL